MCYTLSVVSPPPSEARPNGTGRRSALPIFAPFPFLRLRLSSRTKVIPNEVRDLLRERRQSRCFASLSMTLAGGAVSGRQSYRIQVHSLREQVSTLDGGGSGIIGIMRGLRLFAGRGGRRYPGLGWTSETAEAGLSNKENSPCPMVIMAAFYTWT